MFFFYDFDLWIGKMFFDFMKILWWLFYDFLWLILWFFNDFFRSRRPKKIIKNHAFSKNIELSFKKHNFFIKNKHKIFIKS